MSESPCAQLSGPSIWSGTVERDGSGALARDGEDDRLVALIAQMASGEESALAELYDRTLGRVHGLVRRIVRDAGRAQEVTGDVYFQIWRQAARFDPQRGHPLGWLLTIARSRALDSLRRVDPAVIHPDPESLRPGCEGAHETGQTLLDAVSASTQVRAAVERLDPLPRQLIALAYFRGLTHEEIAANCHLPLGTVKSHIRKALMALHGAMSVADSKGTHSK